MVGTALFKALSFQVAVVSRSGQILSRSNCLSLVKVIWTEWPDEWKGMWGSMLLHENRGSRSMSRGQPMGLFSIASVWTCDNSHCIYLTVQCLVTCYIAYTLKMLFEYVENFSGFQQLPSTLLNAFIWICKCT